MLSRRSAPIMPGPPCSAKHRGNFVGKFTASQQFSCGDAGQETQDDDRGAIAEMGSGRRAGGGKNWSAAAQRRAAQRAILWKKYTLLPMKSPNRAALIAMATSMEASCEDHRAQPHDEGRLSAADLACHTRAFPRRVFTHRQTARNPRAGWLRPSFNSTLTRSRRIIAASNPSSTAHAPRRHPIHARRLRHKPHQAPHPPTFCRFRGTTASARPNPLKSDLLPMRRHRPAASSEVQCWQEESDGPPARR